MKKADSCIHDDVHEEIKGLVFNCQWLHVYIHPPVWATVEYSPYGKGGCMAAAADSPRSENLLYTLSNFYLREQIEDMQSAANCSALVVLYPSGR